jgi:hypothetical protein
MLINLGQWKPSRYDREPIENEFRAVLFHNGFLNLRGQHRSSIRQPGWISPSRNPNAVDVDDWHHDFLYPSKGEHYVATWATVKPTELKGQSPFNSFDIIVFANDEYEHRRPTLTEDEKIGRWFVRMFCGKREELI